MKQRHKSALLLASIISTLVTAVLPAAAQPATNVVYSNGFEGAVGAEWSLNQIALTPVMTNCVVNGNTAGGDGDGIYNRFHLRISHSAISGFGAEIWNDDGDAKLSGSTLVGNSIKSTGSGATLEVQNCTVWAELVADDGCVILQNSIVTFVRGAIASDGHNLIMATNSSTGWMASDLTGSIESPLSPRLGSLRDNGGPTPTMALRPGSPAIDAGGDGVFLPPSNATTDQRGGHRVVDRSGVPNAPGGNGSDIGAVEMGGYLRITDLRINGPQVDISFTADTGFPHHLESKEALAPGPWTLVPGSARTGNGTVLTVPDIRPRVPQRFYRAVMTP